MVRIKKDTSEESTEEKPKKGFSIKRVEKSDHVASNRAKNHGETTGATDPDDMAKKRGFSRSANSRDDQPEHQTGGTAENASDGGLFRGKKNSDDTPRVAKNTQKSVMGRQKKEISQEDLTKRKVDDICSNINRVFNNVQAGIISNEDYIKVVEFLLKYDRFDTVVMATEHVGSGKYSLRSRLIAQKTGELLAANDLRTLYDLYGHEVLSDSIIDNRCDLGEYLDSYIQRNAKAIEAVPKAVDDLKRAFPSASYYPRMIDESSVRVSANYANEDIIGCDSFGDLDAQYNRYKQRLEIILDSDVFKQAYTNKFRTIVSDIDRIEDLKPILLTLDTNMNPFLEPSGQILADRMDELTRHYMTTPRRMDELNVQFNRANTDVRDRVSESYFESVVKILSDRTHSVEELSEDYRAVNWGYMHVDGRESIVVDAYCKNVIAWLLRMNTSNIPVLKSSVPRDDGRVSKRLAELLIGPVASDEVPFDSLYAWLEYFQNVTDKSNEVSLVDSKICLQIGKGLIQNNPEEALAYFEMAVHEDLGGLEVYAILIKAQKSLDDGNTGMALKYAHDAILNNPRMTCAGKAFTAYISNISTPGELSFCESVDSFIEEMNNLDQIISATALDYMAMTYCAGNLSRVDLVEKLADLKTEKSKFFEAFCETIRGIELLRGESFSEALDAFSESMDLAGEDERLTYLNRMGYSACLWATNSEMTAGKLKSICEETQRMSSVRIDTWLSLYISGLVDDHQISWNYAADKYIRAMDYVFDKTELRILASRMYIKMNEPAEAKRILEGNNDNVSEIMRLEIDFLVGATGTATRPKGSIEKLSLETPYQRALADRLLGMAEDYHNVWGKAADKYGEGLKELANSKRRRDVLMRADLYRKRAKAQYKVSRQNLAKVNEDYEAAIELLLNMDDGTSEFKQMMEDIEKEKASVNSSTEVVEESPRDMSVKALDFGGIDLVMRGGPIGKGGTYNVYAASSTDGRRYAVRLLKRIDPYVTTTNALTKSEESKLQNEEDIWKELSDYCPDKVVQLIGSIKIRDVPAQIMEFADKQYSRIESSLSIRERQEVVIRVLDCLASIHEAGFVHNDVKPDNIMQVGGVWKIADFDTAFEEGESTPNPGGTFQYESPEQFSGGEITSKSDIWAVGVLLCHSLYMRYPFSGAESEYKSNVMKGEFDRGVISQTYIPLLERVFSLDPEVRPTAAEFAEELRNITGSRRTEADE